MSAPNDPATLVRSIYATFFAGDLERWLGYFDDRSVLIEAESLPYGGRHVGQDAIRAAIGLILDTWDGLTFDIVDILAGETSAMAYGRLSGRSRTTGRAIDFALVERWVFDGATVREVAAVYGDTAAVVAALAGAVQ